MFLFFWCFTKSFTVDWLIFFFNSCCSLGHCGGTASSGQIWSIHLQWGRPNHSDGDICRRPEQRVLGRSEQQAPLPVGEAEWDSRRIHCQGRGSELCDGTGQSLATSHKNCIGVDHTDITHVVCLLQISMHYNIPPPPDFSAFNISSSVMAKCKTNRPQIILFVAVRYISCEVVTIFSFIFFPKISS